MLLRIPNISFLLFGFRGVLVKETALYGRKFGSLPVSQVYFLTLMYI